MSELGDLLAAYVDQGDEDAMEELVARTRSRLLNAVRHLPDAEDAVQAAYLALLQAAPCEDGPDAELVRNEVARLPLTGIEADLPRR